MKNQSRSFARARASFALLALGVLVTVAPPAVRAGDSVTDRLQAWSRSPTALGSLAGARQTLDHAGVHLSLFYNHLVGVVLDGGAGTGGRDRQSGSADLIVLVDTERLGLITGGSALLHVKSQWGRNVNERVAAVSDPFDDADGNEAIYVDQLWYEQRLWGGRVRVRLGYLDEQTILDRNAYANSEDTQFMATFLDNDNAIVPLAIGLGASMFVDLCERLTLIGSVADAEGQVTHAGFDTAFDDPRELFLYGELDLSASLPGPSGVLPGTYRVGVLSDPRERVVFGTESAPGGRELEREDVGFYLSFDQRVLAARSDPRQGLGLFVRYGYRAPDVNTITQFWSFGFEWTGLVPARGADAFGIGSYGAYGSQRLRDAGDRAVGREIGIEGYYRFQLTPWLAVSPDLQLIHDPGARTTADDAWIAGLRMRVAL